MKQCIKVDLENRDHSLAVVALLNDYMEDDMGQNASMPEALAPKIIEGLKKQENYRGFLVEMDGKSIALANCFVNYSTWQAKQLLNIHDFVVSPQARKLGVGEFLLKEIHAYAKEQQMCKVTLEVREDNFNAQKLYKRVGYKAVSPNYLFWINDLK